MVVVCKKSIQKKNVAKKSYVTAKKICHFFAPHPSVTYYLKLRAWHKIWYDLLLPHIADQKVMLRFFKKFDPLERDIKKSVSDPLKKTKPQSL